MDTPTLSHRRNRQQARRVLADLRIRWRDSPHRVSARNSTPSSMVMTDWSYPIPVSSRGAGNDRQLNGRLHTNGRTMSAECRCPVCSSIISPDMLASIVGAEECAPA